MVKDNPYFSNLVKFAAENYNQRGLLVSLRAKSSSIKLSLLRGISISRLVQNAWITIRIPFIISIAKSFFKKILIVTNSQI
jgi:hypothetical protein